MATFEHSHRARADQHTLASAQRLLGGETAQNKKLEETNGSAETVHK